jgi:hypothetical protein
MPLVLLGLLKYVLIAIIWLFFIFAFGSVYRETRRAVRTTVEAKLVPTAGVEEPRSGSEPANAMLLAIEGPYTGQTFRFATPAVIGRDSSCQICLSKDNYVSAKHAELTRSKRALVVSDLGSRNGTLVNGDKVQVPTKITKGDVVQVGQSALRVVDK